ncbi:MAG: ATP-binding protein [Gammaproteobacteria bacterium]|nr:ATP-binding protein [Gammaproteobacteria bacterium]
MDDFVGRAKELRLLASAVDSAHSAFIPIYGRRRVGKSELILKFMTGRRGVYYVGKQSPPELQVREFLRQASNALGIPVLAELRIDDWSRALAVVVEQSIMAKPGAKLVLALDEFQWIAASDPRIVAALQECWDRDWKPSGAVVLLLCGSYVGFMEREVLGRSSPLFGRRTAQIHLQPFDYREAALFHPRWSPVDQAKAYFLVGGLPQYLLCLDDGRSIDANIRANLLDDFAPLFHEPTFLLREEVREVAPYHAVLFAIASGSHTAGEIATATGLPERNLHYYFDQLVGLGYVRRRHPLDGGPRNSKQVRFIVDDPLLRFYFRFVFPNTSALKSAGVSRTFADAIKPSLDAWYGEGFERLCREALPLIYSRERVDASFEIGEFWSRETQIDVVGLRADNWTDLGECKWGPIRSPASLEAELARKVGLYRNPQGASLNKRYFARNKPSSRVDAEGWYSLEDLYALT